MNGENNTSILDCIQSQLEEMEMLQSMFPLEKEIEITDPTLFLDAEEYVKSNGKLPTNLPQLSFNINLELIIESKDTNEIKCSVCVSVDMPSMYPNIHPNISVVSNHISRTSQSMLNKDLHQFLLTLEENQVVLMDLVSWLQENISNYYTVKEEIKNVENCSPDNEIYFMWLYMHHIYSKNKRKDIINWANELELTGFSLPGKPGVVYIEGTLVNVEDYFERLRRLNWKRLSCKVKEQCEKRVFHHFEELCFDCHGGRDYHMDMGKFFTFLNENNLGHMFKELFGIEGHSNIDGK